MRLQQHHAKATGRGIQRHTQPGGTAADDCKVVLAILGKSRHKIGTGREQRKLRG
jgi:hypothetical protein